MMSKNLLAVSLSLVAATQSAEENQARAVVDFGVVDFGSVRSVSGLSLKTRTLSPSSGFSALQNSGFQTPTITKGLRSALSETGKSFSQSFSRRGSQLSDLFSDDEVGALSERFGRVSERLGAARTKLIRSGSDLRDMLTEGTKRMSPIMSDAPVTKFTDKLRRVRDSIPMTSTPILSVPRFRGRYAANRKSFSEADSGFQKQFTAYGSLLLSNLISNLLGNKQELQLIKNADKSVVVLGRTQSTPVIDVAVKIFAPASNAEMEDEVRIDAALRDEELKDPSKIEFMQEIYFAGRASSAELSGVLAVAKSASSLQQKQRAVLEGLKIFCDDDFALGSHGLQVIVAARGQPLTSGADPLLAKIDAAVAQYAKALDSEVVKGWAKLDADAVRFQDAARKRIKAWKGAAGRNSVSFRDLHSWISENQAQLSWGHQVEAKKQLTKNLLQLTRLTKQVPTLVPEACAQLGPNSGKTFQTLENMLMQYKTIGDLDIENRKNSLIWDVKHSNLIWDPKDESKSKEGRIMVIDHDVGHDEMNVVEKEEQQTVVYGLGAVGLPDEEQREASSVQRATGAMTLTVLALLYASIPENKGALGITDRCEAGGFSGRDAEPNIDELKRQIVMVENEFGLTQTPSFKDFFASTTRAPFLDDQRKSVDDSAFADFTDDTLDNYMNKFRAMFKANQQSAASMSSPLNLIEDCCTTIYDRTECARKLFETPQKFDARSRTPNSVADLDLNI